MMTNTRERLNALKVPAGAVGPRHPLELPAYLLAISLVSVIPVTLYLLDTGYLFYGAALLVSVILLREIDRRAAHANAVLLSRRQFPDIYQIVDEFSRKLGLRWVPDVYVISGDGILDAYATESWARPYIVLHSELFADQSGSIRNALAYIIAHELGHIKLRHTSMLYMMPIAPWKWLGSIPYFGPVLGLPYNILNRFREYSADRIAAQLAPTGINGLLLLAAGRYVYEHVDLDSFLEQVWSRETRGLWTGIAELFSTHPFLANRVRTLYKLGFFTHQRAASWSIDQATGFVDDAEWGPFLARN